MVRVHRLPAALAKSAPGAGAAFSGEIPLSAGAGGSTSAAHQIMAGSGRSSPYRKVQFLRSDAAGGVGPRTIFVGLPGTGQASALIRSAEQVLPATRHTPA